MICGPNGWSFIYNDSYSASRYNTWLTMNNQWCKAAGFNISFTSGVRGGTNNNLFLQKGGLDGAFLYQGGSAKPYYYNNTAEISTDYFAGQNGDIYNQLSKISPSPNSPLFVSVFVTVQSYCFDNGSPVGFTRIKNEMDKLNASYPGRFVFLKPGDLIASAK